MLYKIFFDSNDRRYMLFVLRNLINDSTFIRDDLDDYDFIAFEKYDFDQRRNEPITVYDARGRVIENIAQLYCFKKDNQDFSVDEKNMVIVDKGYFIIIFDDKKFLF